jgi:hypothetical protein
LDDVNEFKLQTRQIEKQSFVIDIPPSLHVEFDFRVAIAEGGIVSIDTGPDSDQAWVEAELDKPAIARAYAS